MLAGYGFSILWAVDRGMAGYGFIKYLPVLLFALVLMQMDEAQSKAVYQIIPWLGALMTVLAYILQFVPVASDYVLINNRLVGSFQYANTYALFLLVGIVELLFARKPDRWTLILGTVMAFGIFASGSRTSFILLVLVVVVYCIRSRNLKTIVAIIGLVVFTGAVSWALSRLVQVESDR